LSRCTDKEENKKKMEKKWLTNAFCWRVVGAERGSPWLGVIITDWTRRSGRGGGSPDIALSANPQIPLPRRKHPRLISSVFTLW